MILYKSFDALLAKDSALKAINYHKLINEHNHTGGLYLILAEIEYSLGNHEKKDFAEYIKKAENIYLKIRDIESLVRCYMFKSNIFWESRLHFLAIENLENNYSMINKKVSVESHTKYLYSLIYYSMMTQQVEKAEKYIKHLSILSSKSNIKLVEEKLLEAKSLKFEMQKDREQEINNKNLLIEKYWEKYYKKKSIFNKGKVLFSIAKLNLDIGNARVALEQTNSCISIFKDFKNKEMLVESELLKHSIKKQLNTPRNTKKELNKLLKIVEGTSLNELRAIINAELSFYYVEKKSIKKAKFYFNDAMYIFNKYQLGSLYRIDQLSYLISDLETNKK